MALAGAVEPGRKLASTSWKAILGCCTTLDKAGCALAWCLVNAWEVSQQQENSSFWTSIFASDMVHRAAQRGAALPMREGDFCRIRGVFERVHLHEVLEEDFVRVWAPRSWTILACFACNALWGGPRPFADGPWSSLAKRMGDAVEISVKRLRESGQAEASDFEGLEIEMLGRRVNYMGEEVGVCHRLTFDQVIPSLPPIQHGGSINVLDFVSSTTRFFLENPDKMVVEDTGQVLPGLQGKIHMEGSDRDKIADALVERGVCSWIPLDEVAEFRGQKIHNGMFGVQKSGTTEGGRPILRLIMNLIPSNAILRQFTGATRNLPHITAWLSIFIEDGEELRIWQSDMSNAFYLFKVPRQWYKYLSFSIFRQKVVRSETNSKVWMCLACNVLPMGWGSSVAIMQEVSERLLKQQSIPREAQIIRGRPVPLWMVGILERAKKEGRFWWHVYLDNFAVGGVAEQDGDFSEGDRIHMAAETAWKESGVISAEKKRKTCELTGQELGAYFHGELRTMGPSPERLLKLVQATVWLLGRGSLSRRLVQVLAGRWVYVFQFRRPAMSFLECCWECVSSKGVQPGLQGKVRREFFMCLSAVPLLHAFLGAEICSFITASDASGVGGAVGIARSLTTSGEDFVRYAQASTGTQTTGILVVSLFNGIGGSFRSYDILGVRPVGLVAFDIHPPAQRVTSRRWPHAELYGDVRKLDETMVEQWVLRYTGLTEIHLWGGFPCTDLSSVRANRQGLAGPQSSLFYEMPRVFKVLKKVVPGHVEVKFVAENVASMAKAECQTITEELGVYPYHLNCADAVPMQRPRLCWSSEPLEQCLEGLTFSEGEYWTEVTAKADYPLQEQWVEPGFWWYGEEQGYTLPTAMKSIVRQRPPLAPAGIKRCNEDTLARYEADQFRFPPYHYLERFLFWKEDTWRLANSSEKELLLGYGFGHTSLCYSASKIKQSPTQYEDERLSLLGDAFSIFSFVIAAAALCKAYIPRMHYQHLARRMGMAPGCLSPLRMEAPIGRYLQYGMEKGAQTVDAMMLNRILSSKTNHTGSDVRISTGEVLNPKSATRQSIEADWWQWDHLFSFRWKAAEHINSLELRTILQAVKFYTSHFKTSHARIFHVTDSYVCMSVLAKGRTGSRLLAQTLRKINALLLGFGLHCIVAHVESTQNPTDEASRL